MKVSCIMPTYNRRQFIGSAIRCYLEQEWPDKELIVIDDGEDEVRDLFVGVLSCVYVRLADRMNVGAKRNLACEAAAGEFICHFDDDDWSAPNRITEQVSRLLDSGKAVTGYHDLLFWCAATKSASMYRNPDPGYGCGTSLCYRKSWWKSHPFPSTSKGEDNQFVRVAKRAGEAICVPGRQIMVARIHPNSVSKRYSGSYPQVPITQIPEAFFAA